MRIAIGQLDCRVGDSAANEARLLEAVAEARHAGADLLVTPELQLSGYALRADGHTARTIEEVASLLDASGLAAVVGFHERVGASTFNSAAWIENGFAVHVHHKLYLCGYPPFDEDVLYEPGDAMRSFDTPFGRVAILTCNDAWQPFLPALAAHDGAELLVIPAASSTTVPEAEAIWHDLTRSYARVLGCHVVFANQAGSEGGFAFWGGSHVVDPAGEIVAQAGADETILFADVDLGQAALRRTQLPLLGELRPELLVSELGRLARSRA